MVNISEKKNQRKVNDLNLVNQQDVLQQQFSGPPWVPLGLPDSSFGEAARHIPTFQELVPQKSGGGETIEKCGKSSWINMVQNPIDYHT